MEHGDPCGCKLLAAFSSAVDVEVTRNRFCEQHDTGHCSIGEPDEVVKDYLQLLLDHRGDVLLSVCGIPQTNENMQHTTNLTHAANVCEMMFSRRCCSCIITDVGRAADEDI